MMQKHVIIDFETRSEADLKKVGTARYAEDPSTEAKMMCWAYGDGPVRRWRGDVWLEVGGWPDEPPQELFDLIEQGVIVEAHNAFFERMIWRNVMVKRYGWPDIPDAQWRCSAAKAAACSLPRGLGQAAEALRLTTEKDKEGHALMLRLCKPRAQWSKWKRGELVDSKTGELKPEPEKYFQSLEEFERELDYCARDVETERALSKSIPDMKPFEWEVWAADQRMNARGIKCDIPMAKHMVDLVEKYREHMRDELRMLTDGEIEKETQRAKVLDWFVRNDTTLPDAAGNFILIDNTQAGTLDEVAEFYQYDNYNRGRVAQIIRQLNKSSVSKYRAMIQRASEEDGRARGTLVFNGASTGRWAGSGLQLQNVPGGKIKNMDAAVDEVKALETVNQVFLAYDEPMEAFSGLIRGALMASEGHELVVADYASIEARGVMWLAQEHEGLKIFHSGDCIYCDMASDVYGWEVEKAKAKQGDPKHSSARNGLGKKAILGLGYQMGAPKFLDTCEKGGLYFTDDLIDELVPSDDQRILEQEIRENPLISFPKGKIIEPKVRPLILSKFVVNRYRTKYSQVSQYWRDIEEAAMTAVRDHMEKNPRRDWVYVRDYRGPGAIAYKVVGVFLFCKLPSKRHLAYPYPWIKRKKTAWGTEKDTLVFMGVDSFTHRWCEQTTYAGKLTENVTQAASRDVMAEAIVRIDRHPVYTPVLSVHDEIVTEAPIGFGSAKELEEIMAETPSWAKGFPIEVEGWSGQRYRK